LTVLVDPKHRHAVLRRGKVGRELDREMRVTLVAASERGHEEQQKDTTNTHERAGWGGVRNPSRPLFGNRERVVRRESSQCRHTLREVFPTSGRPTLTNGDDP
jgi:hypothetical protein